MIGYHGLHRLDIDARRSVAGDEAFVGAGKEVPAAGGARRGVGVCASVGRHGGTRRGGGLEVHPASLATRSLFV